MTNRVIVIAVALVAVFLIGFVTQCSRAKSSFVRVDHILFLDT
jgi:hypothetical protein